MRLAILDRDQGQIVIRIAYDGPALSGKTTSVKALSSSLGRSVYSAGEAEGRTLYFDWLDYAGGRFEGHEIRCQVVSVPGQTMLRNRRKQLLSAADSIVFVADTTAAGLSSSLLAFEFLRTHLHRGPEPHAGVIVQANKRDAPDCVSLEELRQSLRTEDMVAITESVATDGTGVRETFIFAVRLALDRVRALMQNKTLVVGRPPVDSGADLLQLLASRESSAELPEPAHLVRFLHDEPAVPPSIEPSLPVGAAHEAERAIPRPPDVDVASGMVWPPVEGRIILHDAATAGFNPQRTMEEGWLDEKGDHWLLHSSTDDTYRDVDEGRDALVRWAQIHVSAKARLSPHRCLVLSASFPGEWRLWQIVRKMPSLRTRLSRVVASRSSVDIAGLLLEAGRLIIEAAATSRAELADGTSIIDQIAPHESRAVFIALMPSPNRKTSTSAFDNLSERDLVRRELQAIADAICANRGDDVPAITSHLKRRSIVSEQRELADTLAVMLLGS